MRPLRSAVLLWLLAFVPWPAQAGPREIAAAVVGLKAEIPPEARTADTLGRRRSGSGVVIDSAGLVVTVGYLILEATAVDLYDSSGKRVPADIVAYDQETGFGLLRATGKLAASP
ncbi:MAG: trypsin-like peptidase domain-containing protein, partial [Geminicoccaceae bacterium]